AAEFEHVNSSHSRVFPDKEAMIAGALEMAGEIAARSPVAVQGTKLNLIYSRDHSVAEGLHYMVETLPFFSPPGKLLVFTL
ncbi:putative enoyl CoA hydratase, partial [Xenoophorus captivus]